MTMTAKNKSIKKDNLIKEAFVKSLPIMCSYIFLSIAYGMTMENSGFHWYYSLLISMIVYTGAFQFVLITFLSAGTSVATIALTAFLMNSRQMFYSLTFLETFKKVKRGKWYMIFSMTDETYAVNCTVDGETKRGRKVMFFVALFSWCYWMVGSVIGGVVGHMLPFQLEGIDFCMTALFVIIFIDQWEKTKNHKPAITGLAVAIVCLFIFGKTTFMLPALILVSGILTLTIEQEAREEGNGQ